LQNTGLFCRALLQKRPIFLSILLIVATPYQTERERDIEIVTSTGAAVCVCVCVGERESERERKRARETKNPSLSLSLLFSRLHTKTQPPLTHEVNSFVVSVSVSPPLILSHAHMHFSPTKSTQKGPPHLFAPIYGCVYVFVYVCVRMCV